MSFEQLNSHCYFYKSSVNIGYVHQGAHGLLIDAGIDRSSVKKVLKELKKRELPLTHMIITHAHADHYGGAQYVQENFDVHTTAPFMEEAILRYPQLEPLYLLGGNNPLPELQNKFLQGPPVQIDRVIEEGSVSFGEIHANTYLLPGHSYHQLAMNVHGILFAADAYFGEAMLSKHKIPYITDAGLTIRSLDKLKSIDHEGAVPGHGDFEKDPTSTIDANLAYHKDLLNWLVAYIRLNQEGGVSHEQVISAMCQEYGVENTQLSQWLLYRTAVTAYLITLKKEGKISDQIIDNRWTFFAS
ncbi:MBL fold metallo-hydrolase [Halobacillus fulvus]|nr:MBL fold metallo-hydrolase [Halobacillus fulvus]